jgi:NTP pyrophosphatase (non-canonical NTP hydrolase)
LELIELQQTLRKFAEARSWEDFHTPKNLAMALMVEAAELAEIFQWQTPQESIATRLNPQVQMRTGEELADVLLYLLQLADHTGVDLDLAVADKMLKNAKKYPLPGAQEASATEEQKTAQTHVLVDWENVQPKDADIRSLVPTSPMSGFFTDLIKRGWTKTRSHLAPRLR